MLPSTPGNKSFMVDGKIQISPSTLKSPCFMSKEKNKSIKKYAIEKKHETIEKCERMKTQKRDQKNSDCSHKSGFSKGVSTAFSVAG